MPATSNDAPVVDLADVGRRFGTEPPVDAVRGVDLTIRAGEWIAVTGPSGSGKSTLLNIIGCLDRATTGRYQFAGIDIATLGDRRLAGLRARAIGFVFQSFHLLGHRHVLDNVMLAELYRRGPRKGRRQRAMSALDRVGLSHRADFLPTRLSGGERQRVAIARALVGQPKLLLCDEPTGNLDSATTAAVVEVLRALHAQGMTIAMITHQADVANAAPRQVRIVDGQLARAM